MIVWLASYPKSGNTWVKSFIASLLYTNDGKASLNNLHKKIDQYPMRRQFSNFLSEFNDLSLVKKNWIFSQDLINLDSKIKFLKTHNINCKIGDDHFTNKENTLGVIYIARDPRNVLTSLKYHFSKKNYDETLKMLFDKNHGTGTMDNPSKTGLDNDICTFISSWGIHYNSWKNTKDNFLLVRYEDLIKEDGKEFFRISNYLEKVLNITIDNKKIENAIKTNSFENLKKLEQKYGFAEQITNKSDGKKKKFFNLGKDNRWETLLDTKYAKAIEKEFDNEMKELKYI